MIADKCIAMQVRCVHCDREQWAPIVLSVSLGKAPCGWCGEYSRKMTYAEYKALMAVKNNK